MKVVVRLGEKLEFFIPLKTENHFNKINTRITLQSFRALKRHLNDENLAHNRKTATIEKNYCCLSTGSLRLLESVNSSFEQISVQGQGPRAVEVGDTRKNFDRCARLIFWGFEI